MPRSLRVSRGLGPGGPALEPTEAQVVSIVRGLYDDGLKPASRHVHLRVRQLLTAAAPAATHPGPGAPPGALRGDGRAPLAVVEPRRLRGICEASDQLIVQDAVGCSQGCEYVVLLASRPAEDFADCMTGDPFPKEFWANLKAYFDMFDGFLPSGIYRCAQCLKAKDLRLFDGFTLGQLCHVLRLAYGPKKLLGCSRELSVPYHLSAESQRLQAAALLEPSGRGRNGKTSKYAEACLLVATWEDVRRGLGKLLSDASARGSSYIAMSNVKNLFRNKLHLEFSETALGHTQLFSVLRDPYLEDMYVLEEPNDGQAVIRRRQLSEEPADAPWTAARFARPLPVHPPECQAPLHREAYGAATAGGRQAAEGADFVAEIPAPQVHAPKAKRASETFEDSLETTALEGEEVAQGASGSSAEAPIETARLDKPDVDSTLWSPNRLSIKNTFIHCPAFPDPSPVTATMGMSLFRRLASGCRRQSVSNCLSTESGGFVDAPAIVPLEPAAEVNRPSAIQVFDSSEDEMGGQQAAATCQAAVRSEAEEGGSSVLTAHGSIVETPLNFTVKNAFLHFPASPTEQSAEVITISTPLPGHGTGAAVMATTGMSLFRHRASGCRQPSVSNCLSTENGGFVDAPAIVPLEPTAEGNRPSAIPVFDSSEDELEGQQTAASCQTAVRSEAEEGGSSVLTAHGSIVETRLHFTVKNTFLHFPASRTEQSAEVITMSTPLPGRGTRAAAGDEE